MTPYDFIKDATIEEIAEVLYEYYQIGTIEECQEMKMKRKMEQNRWIPCSERLPEQYKFVLVTAKMERDKTSLVYQGARCGDSFVLSGVMNSTDYIVTAWQPEPEPWKGENDV